MAKSLISGSFSPACKMMELGQGLLGVILGLTF